MSGKLLSVADRRGEKSLLSHLTFDRSFISKSSTKWLPRGGVIVACRKNLCDFVEAMVQSPLLVRGFNIQEHGLYWEAWHPQQQVYIHPYLDIDIKNIPDTISFNTIFTHVFRAIKACSDMFLTMCDKPDDFDLSITIFFNRREINGRFKYSFHIHWHQLVAPNATTLGAFIQRISHSLPKLPNYDENENEVPGTEPIVDTKPYSHTQQLFRLPYCGKMGDDTAVLQPIHVQQDYNGTWTFEVQNGHIAEYVSKSCTFTIFSEDYVELQMQRIERGPVLSRRDPLPSSGIIRPRDDNQHLRTSWLSFWQPVLERQVLKNFVIFRQKQMQKLGVRAATPDPDALIIESIDRLANYTASYRVEVHGDNFCEYDHGATPHNHRGEDNAISYVIDLSTGKISQQCHKCRPPSLKWKTFIQAGRLTFRVQEEEESVRESASSVTLYKSEDPVLFFLNYFFREILYCKEKKQLMVFNKDIGVWQGGSDGNRLLLDLVDRINDNYKMYRRALNSKITDDKLRQYERDHPDVPAREAEKAKEKLNADCRKANASIPNLWQLTMTQRVDLIAKLKSYQHPNTRERMEPFHHLVPLNYAKCIDIYTFTVKDIKPEYYFTSTLNASIIDIRDDTVSDFVAWQNNVCCGDMEYLTWKFRVMGLSLTLLNFDRAVYIPLGPIGRNGKSSEVSLFNDVTMSRTPNRGYNMSREYLTKTSQDRKGANAPDTVLMETSDKCVVIADECRDAPLDGSLIKTFVSGDKTSARNLYESERTTITSYFTLWIIANCMLKLDCSDSALVNRLRFMPYNAQWVTDVAKVKGKLGLPASLYVFQEDPYFKEKTLPLWKDAMVTKTLYELHLFLKTLPRDPENPEYPLKLQSFPVPKVVRNYTTERVQREHPLLAFIQKHLGQTEDPSAYEKLDIAFQQFRQFGRNENSGRIKYMNRSQFQEGLAKENIEVETNNMEIVLSGYYIKKYVENLDKPVDVNDPGASYIPALKRKRDDDEED